MLDKKLVGSYKDYLKKNLSKKRYNHSINVAAEAVKLADKYDADRDKCYLAGLLHDIAKELDTQSQLSSVNNSQLDVCEIEKKSSPLYHAVAGAEMIQDLFGIKDNEIIRAIRYHTVARAQMSKTEQIIYLADLISVDRDYKDVKRMRKYAYQSLEKAMYEALKFSVGDSVKKGNTIPVSTVEAYNEFCSYEKDLRKE